MLTYDPSFPTSLTRSTLVLLLSRLKLRNYCSRSLDLPSSYAQSAPLRARQHPTETSALASGHTYGTSHQLDIPPSPQYHIVNQSSGIDPGQLTYTNCRQAFQRPHLYFDQAHPSYRSCRLGSWICTLGLSPSSRSSLSSAHAFPKHFTSHLSAGASCLH
jgi:hypothetical protein